MLIGSRSLSKQPINFTVGDIGVFKTGEQVRRASQEAVLSNERRTPFGVVLTLSVFGLGVTQWVSTPRFLVFAGLVLSLNLVSAACAAKCLHSLHQADSRFEIWSVLQIVASAAGGVCWGVGSLVMGFSDDPAPHAILAIFQGALLTITTITMATDSRRYNAFIAPMAISAIGANLIVGQRLQLAVAFGIVVFGLLLKSLQKDLKKTYTDNVELRFSNEALLAELSEANARLALDNSELQQQVITDALTQLRNRKGWERALHGTFHPDSAKDGVAIMIIDVDHFKSVNDNYGHDAGDKVLVSLSKRLRACVKETDTVARLGGDEFAVLLHNVTSNEDLDGIAERIKQRLALDFRHGGMTTAITVSLGAARCQPGERYEQLILRADARLYEAKRNRPHLHPTFPEVPLTLSHTVDHQ
jgi:diguanylate cyclase (GGDEF)-like protein